MRLMNGDTPGVHIVPSAVVAEHTERTHREWLGQTFMQERLSTSATQSTGSCADPQWSATVPSTSNTSMTGMHVLDGERAYVAYEI